jgi:Concanavalin A-like lectin/glucanases superfamily
MALIRFSPCTDDQTCCGGNCGWIYASNASDNGGDGTPDTPIGGPTEDPDHEHEFSRFWTLISGAATPHDTQYIDISGPDTFILNSLPTSTTLARCQVLADTLHNGDIINLRVGRADADNYVLIEFSNFSTAPRLAIYRITNGSKQLLRCKENFNPDYDADTVGTVTLRASLARGVLLTSIQATNSNADYSFTHPDHDAFSGYTYRPLTISVPPDLNGDWNNYPFTLTSGNWGLGGTAADSDNPFRILYSEAWNTQTDGDFDFYAEFSGCKPDTLCCGMLFEFPESIFIESRYVLHNAKEWTDCNIADGLPNLYQAGDPGAPYALAFDCACTDVNATFELYWSPFLTGFGGGTIVECHFEREGLDNASCTDYDPCGTEGGEHPVLDGIVGTLDITTYSPEDGVNQCALEAVITGAQSNADNAGTWLRSLPQFWIPEDAIGEFDVEFITPGDQTQGICNYAPQRLFLNSLEDFTFEPSDCGDKTLSAATAAFTLSAKAAHLDFGHRTPAGHGTCSVSGKPIGLRATRRLPGAKATITLTGVAAKLRRGLILHAAAASFTGSAKTAALRTSRQLHLTKATFTLTAISARLAATRQIHLTKATFTLSAIAARLAHCYTLSAAKSVFTESAKTTALRTSRQLHLTKATFTLTAISARLAATRQIHLTKATFTLSAIAARLAHCYILTAAKSAFAFSSIAAALRTARRLTADRSIYFCQSLTPTGLRAARRLTSAKSAFTFTGIAATLIAQTARVLSASPASFALNGQTAGVRAGRKIPAAASVFSLSGKTVALRAARRLTAASATFIVTANAATLTEASTNCMAAVKAKCTAYWKFDNNLTDSVGSYSFTNGTNAGESPQYHDQGSSPPAILTNALYFPDNPSPLEYVQSSAPLGGYEKLAFMFWCWDAGPSFGGADGEGGDFYVFNQTDDDVHNGFFFDILADGKAEIQIANDATFGVARTAALFRSATLNHFAILYDGSQGSDANRLKLYVNGSQITLTFITSIPGNVGTTTLPLILGGYVAEYPDALDKMFVGLIDEMAYIAGNVFTTTDIACHYNGGLGATTP